MGAIMDVYGTPIDISTIKEYRICEFEYIYRPIYRECIASSFLGAKKTKKYDFDRMQPYAAVLAENGHRSALAEYKPTNIGEAMLKDVGHFIGLLAGGLVDALNMRTAKYKKYLCISKTGRTFETYMHEIPTVIYRADGKVSDVHPNDELFCHVAEPIAPTIQIVSALTIATAKNKYVFFGDNIQLPDVSAVYVRLRQMIEQEEANKKLLKPGKATLNLSRFIPQIKLPGKSVQHDPVGFIEDVTRDGK